MMVLKRIEDYLFFLCILFLPTQLGKHFFLNFSFIYSLPIDYLAPTVYFWDFLLLFLIIVWFLRKPKISDLALNLLLFFLLTQIISLVRAENIGASFYRLEQYLICGLFGLYIASQKFENLKEKLIPPLILATIFESLLAIWQFIFGKTLGLWILGERSFSVTTPSIAKFDFYGQVFLRAYGTFSHPNVLAAFLLISLVVIYGLGGLGRLGVLGRYWRLGVFLSVVVIFLTFSRTAIFILLIFLVIIFRKNLKKLWPLYFIAPFLIIRFWGAFNFDSIALIQREQLAVLSIQFFLSSPIFGVGLNNFINQSSVSILAGGARFLQPVHNIFLLTLSETGLLGGLGLLGLLGVPLINLWKTREFFYSERKRGSNSVYSKVILGSFLIILFLGMFDHYFLTLAQGQRLFFLIWGLSLSRMYK